MNYNISLISDHINKLLKVKAVNAYEFSLCDDGHIRCNFGNVAYYFDYKMIKDILTVNDVDLTDWDATYSTLAKYFINQINGALGYKVYPEIISLPFDFMGESKI